ncbi:hydrogenase maturation protease [Clostridium sp. BSD9I1]|uniref:hydrogenase maturation protease n=1 Tax=Clostridium sp. BSD9I1 TaxID=2003589 RepID=UPI00241BE986|nr:hydrogenase maturation protease [Clostridium sp. BSD9I1]
MIKIIAIGNRLMGDDGIALKVLENIDKDIKTLKGDREVNEEIEVIIGETDFMYCLDNIDNNDFIIILDSTALGVNPGSITTLSFNEYKRYLNCVSQHELNLVNMLISYKKNVDGIIIGIEASDIDFNFDISDTLKLKFSDICRNVLKKIMRILVDFRTGD